MADAPRTLFTVGHSTHPIERFIELLAQHHITAVADVRSQPYSRWNPQHNRENLKKSLAERGIAYVFLGGELGARSEDDACYEGDQVQFDRLARTPLFQTGIQRVLTGMDRFTVSLMCAEKEPLDCHRTILVSRHLAAAGADVRHILADGTGEPHDETLSRLIRLLKLPENDLFTTRAELVERAYSRQAEQVAYRREPRA